MYRIYMFYVLDWLREGVLYIIWRGLVYYIYYFFGVSRGSPPCVGAGQVTGLGVCRLCAWYMWPWLVYGVSLWHMAFTWS